MFIYNQSPSSVGKLPHECVIGVEVREVPNQQETWLKTYGTIDGAAELMHVSWPKM